MSADGKRQPAVKRRTVLKAAGGGLVVGQTAADDECGVVDRILGNCDEITTVFGSDDDADGASGTGMPLTAYISRAEHPEDAEIGEGNVALYVVDGTLYQRPYGRDETAVGSGGGGGGAPTDAEYVTLSTDGTLSAERTLNAATGLSLTDNGANSAVDLSLTDTDVQVAGNTVSLGGSTSVDHSDLSNIGSSDHHTKYTDSEAVSAVESEDPLSPPGVVALGDNAADPAANGEIARNSSDVKVYSGGSVRNLSNIGGSTSPGGSDTQLQYNNSGSFGGISGFTYDGTNLSGVPGVDATLALVNQAADPSANGEIQLNGSDVKVYSGGSVRNLSNVGSGGSAITAQEDGSNLTTDMSLLNAADGITATNPTGDEIDLKTQTVTTTSSSYTASDLDVVLADASGGNLTVQLPAPSTDVDVTVKKTDSSGNDVVVDTPGSENIDGQSSRSISGQYNALTIVSDGSNFFIV